MRHAPIFSAEQTTAIVDHTRAITAQIRVAENTLDNAGIELMKLNIQLLEARQAAKLNATFGEEEVFGSVNAISQWAQTRRTTIETHRGLLKLAGRVGTRELAAGDGDTRPADVVAPVLPIPSAKLRSVA